MKKTLIVLLIGIVAVGLLWAAAKDTGRKSQVVVIPLSSGARAAVSQTQDRSNPLTYVDSHYFILPENVKTDTLQLLFWQYSADGAAHSKISAWQGIKFLAGTGPANSTTYKFSADSMLVVADGSTESAMLSYLVVPSVKDTTENLAGFNMLPSAIKINIMGTTSNSHDNRYAIQLVGRLGTE